MAKCSCSLVIEVRFAWWFTCIYLPLLAATINVMWLLGVEYYPDNDRVRAVVNRAARLYLNGKRVRG